MRDVTNDIKFKIGTKFLVTGGAGFIGSNICEYILNMGYEVVCLDNFSTGKPYNIDSFKNHKNFTFIQGDIRDFEICILACNGVDFVLHQAAWGSVPRSIEMPLIYEDVNVKGTLNMLEAAKQTSVKKFVYASSSAVYGNTKAQYKKEGEEGDLLSPYAFTKYANEKYATLYSSIYGLDTYGLRYFNVFGERQDPTGDYAAVIPKFIKSLLNNEPPIINGDGTQSRDFTYIQNVINANLKACLVSSKYSGSAFNIACGKDETLLSMYATICKLLDKDIKPVFGNERLGDIKHSKACITKAKEVLNYVPTYNFKEGIEQCVKWYSKALGTGSFIL